MDNSNNEGLLSLQKHERVCAARRPQNAIVVCTKAGERKEPARNRSNGHSAIAFDFVSSSNAPI